MCLILPSISWGEHRWPLFISPFCFTLHLLMLISTSRCEFHYSNGVCIFINKQLYLLCIVEANVWKIPDEPLFRYDSREAIKKRLKTFTSYSRGVRLTGRQAFRGFLVELEKFVKSYPILNFNNNFIHDTSMFDVVIRSVWAPGRGYLAWCHNKSADTAEVFSACLFVLDACAL